jgi:hypothetical protein
MRAALTVLCLGSMLGCGNTEREGASLAGGGGGSGATSTGGAGSVSSGGEGGAVDGCAAIESDSCTYPLFLSFPAPECIAPASVGGEYRPVAAWALRTGSGFAASSRELATADLWATNESGAWVAQAICFVEGISATIALDEETEVREYKSPLGGWSLIIGSQTFPTDDWAQWPTPRALSGSTFVAGTFVFVREDGIWSLSSMTFDAMGATLQSLGHDRIALLDADETRLVQRVDTEWVDVSTLPPALSASMTEDGTLVALGNESSVDVYSQQADTWELEVSLDASALAAGTLGSKVTFNESPSLGLLLTVWGGEGVHFFDPATWTLRDSIPATGDVVAAKDTVVVYSEDPSLLSGVPELLGQYGSSPPAAIVLVYTPSQ